MRGRGRPGICLVLLALLLVCLCARSAELVLAQLHHKAWRVHDGTPSDVRMLAQTSDGYLWLGTAAGLYRFDGVGFESLEAAYQVATASNDISALMATPDGGLWIGYRFGGASYLKDGRITHYQRDLKGNNWFPGSGSTRWFAQEQDGTVWSTGDSLNVFRHQKWQAADDSLPKGSTSGVLVDRLGGVWAGLRDGLYWRARDAKKFIKVSDRSSLTFFAEGPDGSVWAVSNGIGLSRFDPQTGSPREMPKGVAEAIHEGRISFDRQGNLWSATTDALLVRLPAKALAEGTGPGHHPVQLFSEKDGLTGGAVYAVLEDREGSVWVGTTNGLDRFRESRVVPQLLPTAQAGGMLGMAAAEGGQVWLSDWAAGVFLAGSSVEAADAGLQHVTMAYRAPSGRVWMGNKAALWLRENGQMRRIAWPVRSAQLVPQAATEDREGGLWVALAFDGVFRYHDGAWVDKTPLFKLGQKTAYAMATDAKGAVWISYGRNTLLKAVGDSVDQYGAAQGLDLGTILAIVPSGGQLWLGGINSVMQHDGERFRHLVGRGAHRFNGVSGIVATAQGDLWLNGDDGIIHIGSAELAKWRASPDYGVAYTTLDFLDGVEGKPAHARPLPTALEGSDGRLWFSFEKRIVAVDPSRVLFNALPPQVKITQVNIDGVRVRPGAPVVLAPGAQRIEIDFAGLSLKIPERNRYRYRLLGVDRDWIVGRRQRSVSYTNLAPGSYRFEVDAANNDGVWSTAPAQLSFEVQPAFYQTWWFRGAVVLLLMAALWLAYRLRMKVLTRRISERLQSQQMERVRIARELHDTLLQGVGSLSLMVHGAMARVDREHPVVPFLADGLKQAESVIAEGRERVARLRVAVEAGDVLIDELGILGLELTAGSATRFALSVQGHTRSLETRVAEECRAIAREAIWNAVQHANAGTITLAIDFGRRMLTLQVGDDGCGLPLEVVAGGGREGHWGMPGMRERAGRIGGHVELLSGAGTTVRLSVPASLAYKKR